MAPKATKAKGHKPRGAEKKKREDKALLPTVLDIEVNIPGEEKSLLLKGISTDRILDVRRLLAVHGASCHYTNYSLSHEIRGDGLRESLEVTSLKPCSLDLVEEDYTEETAVAHVRRLLDIVACTTSFGMSASEREAKEGGDVSETGEVPAGKGGNRTAREDAEGHEENAGEALPGSAEGGAEGRGLGRKASSGAAEDVEKEGAGKGKKAGDKGNEGVKTVNGAGSSDRKLVPFKGKPEAVAAMAAAAAATEKGDMTGMCPRESKLGHFYDFLSASHLTTPIQSIKRGSKTSLDAEEFFTLDIRLCSGKLVTVTAGKYGFSGGRQWATERTLVALLQRISHAFEKAYADLLAFFAERNKFGNTPIGFRSNTWVVPPPAAGDPRTFPPLPVEDEAWGGSGGGQGRPGEGPKRNWARDLRVLAKMPCETLDERLRRDRLAFLVHNALADTAIRWGVSAIEDCVMRELAATGTESVSGNSAADTSFAPTSKVVEGGQLQITVVKDSINASVRVARKLDVDPERGLSPEAIAEKGLLKGLTANESTAVHDTAALGTVLVYHRGYSARVQVVHSPAAHAAHKAGVEDADEEQDIEIEAQPDGGANALNPNSLRSLLHLSPAATSSRLPSDAAERSNSAPSSAAALIDWAAAEDILRGVLSRSVASLEEELFEADKYIRWELGACWVQHLQEPVPAVSSKVGGDKDTGGAAKGAEAEVGKEEQTEEYSGGEGASGKDAERATEAAAAPEVVEEELTAGEIELKEKLGEANFRQLKEAHTGLHKKTVAELLEGAKKYYAEVAIPKLVADFGSLELSPVDGRTLTDFMHARGLRMRSLGKVAEQSENLLHVRSLCLHEMATRAWKHLFRAIIAATTDATLLPAVIAATLNAILGGVPEEGGPGASSVRSPQEQDAAGGTVVTGKSTPKAEQRGDKTDATESSAGEQVEGEGGSRRQGQESRGRGEALGCAVWKWVEVFAQQRFHWEVEDDDRSKLRKLAILRALCLKVGIEIAPKSYDLESLRPFSPIDIISMFPIYKHVACTTTDGRLLLESSKSALDKGKLDEAVACGTKALARLVVVCGPYHRMTAGAYSLLAVVLYHTGDFNQATVYQQKALDINERELGLDHPDTMKSYGDLAVFYYRLQHTELALKYVNRALYLLHLTCGPSHPNTAATFINIAMMEEGLGNVHLALRYLHEALKCNQRLLGPEHIQTAASYHAIAIALSLMEAYSLSKQHEQTTLAILQEKLGPDDLRTQDAAAWLEYFDSKAIEQMEAQRTGAPKPDASIASKGHLSVSDLLEFINEEGKTGVRMLDSKRKGLKPRAVKVRGALSAGPFAEVTSEGVDHSETVKTAAASVQEADSAAEPLSEDATPGGTLHALLAGRMGDGAIQGAQIGEEPAKSVGTAHFAEDSAELVLGKQPTADGPATYPGAAAPASSKSFTEEQRRLAEVLGLTEEDGKEEDDGWQAAGPRGRLSSAGAYRRGAPGAGGMGSRLPARTGGGSRSYHHAQHGSGSVGARHGQRREHHRGDSMGFRHNTNQKRLTMAPHSDPASNNGSVRGVAPSAGAGRPPATAPAGPLATPVLRKEGAGGRVGAPLSLGVAGGPGWTAPQGGRALPAVTAGFSRTGPHGSTPVVASRSASLLLPAPSGAPALFATQARQPGGGSAWQGAHRGLPSSAGADFVAVSSSAASEVPGNNSGDKAAFTMTGALPPLPSAAPTVPNRSTSPSPRDAAKSPVSPLPPTGADDGDTHPLTSGVVSKLRNGSLQPDSHRPLSSPSAEEEESTAGFQLVVARRKDNGMGRQLDRPSNNRALKRVPGRPAATGRNSPLNSAVPSGNGSLPEATKTNGGKGPQPPPSKSSAIMWPLENGSGIPSRRAAHPPRVNGVYGPSTDGPTTLQPVKQFPVSLTSSSTPEDGSHPSAPPDVSAAGHSAGTTVALPPPGVSAKFSWKEVAAAPPGMRSSARPVSPAARPAAPVQGPDRPGSQSLPTASEEALTLAAPATLPAAPLSEGEVALPLGMTGGYQQPRQQAPVVGSKDVSLHSSLAKASHSNGVEHVVAENQNTLNVGAAYAARAGTEQQQTLSEAANAGQGSSAPLPAWGRLEDVVGGGAVQSAPSSDGGAPLPGTSTSGIASLPGLPDTTSRLSATAPPFTPSGPFSSNGAPSAPPQPFCQAVPPLGRPRNGFLQGKPASIHSQPPHHMMPPLPPLNFHPNMGAPFHPHHRGPSPFVTMPMPLPARGPLFAPVYPISSSHQQPPMLPPPYGIPPPSNILLSLPMQGGMMPPPHYAPHHLPPPHGMSGGPPHQQQHHFGGMPPPPPMGPSMPIYRGILRQPPGEPAFINLPRPPLPVPQGPGSLEGGDFPPLIGLPGVPPALMNPLAQEFVPSVPGAPAKKFNPLAIEFIPGLPWQQQIFALEVEATHAQGLVQGNGAPQAAVSWASRAAASVEPRLENKEGRGVDAHKRAQNAGLEPPPAGMGVNREDCPGAAGPECTATVGEQQPQTGRTARLGMNMSEGLGQATNGNGVQSSATASARGSNVVGSYNGMDSSDDGVSQQGSSSSSGDAACCDLEDSTAATAPQTNGAEAAGSDEDDGFTKVKSRKGKVNGALEETAVKNGNGTHHHLQPFPSSHPSPRGSETLTTGSLSAAPSPANGHCSAGSDLLQSSTDDRRFCGGQQQPAQVNAVSCEPASISTVHPAVVSVR
eukprot:TRINITY_DN26344_c0_g1_i1.p1 TRINITY_DN26344_c0_g1~~TRINITY_DN26344_c0_g1_i1.p1  ORF type:complete len:2692 (-),score=551.04 TRINITY_DN26344_c0_g1_i1:1086-9161(-)